MKVKTAPKEPNLAVSSLTVCHVNLDDIILSDDGREHDEKTIAAMADSVRLIGLQTPISIDRDNRLINGKLRFLGVRQAGLLSVDCFVIDGPAIHLWKISENFHRRGLTALENSSALIQWAGATKKGDQLEQVLGGRGKKGGIADSARALGIDRNVMRRAAAIASIAPEVCAAIRSAGLDDNQAALLSIAATPPKQQLKKVETFSAPKSKSASDQDDAGFQALMRAWQNAGSGERARFMAEVMAPYAASRSDVAEQQAPNEGEPA